MENLASNESNEPQKIVLFQEKQIRRTWHNDEWWFSVADVIEVLTGSQDAKQYIKKMRSRDPMLDSNWGTICTPLAMPAPDGKIRKTNASNKRGLFRIIQSVPSAKAEPFKLWLAEVGADRIDEIENPELAADRARELYRAKGYPDEWIEMRLKSIEVRQQLTDEWKNRAVQEGAEYAILTAEIAKATFGLTPTEHKTFKNLQRENLRDHMTNLELIFTMLGEEGTRQNAIESDAQGFDENRKSAQKGGRSAGKARQAFEDESGKKVVSSDNFKKKLPDAEAPKGVD
ncbi:MAG: Bro-N domain-containing protein [Bacteroidota bacterium]